MVSHLFLRRCVLTALLDPFGEREKGLARYVRPRLAGWGEAASEDDAHPIPTRRPSEFGETAIETAQKTKKKKKKENVIRKALSS